MQTLGVSDSLPHSESRIKSLFWPSIRSGSDVDYLGIQGYWVCTFVALMTLVVPLFSMWSVATARQVIIILLFFGMFSLFFYVGGTGVREGSRFAACVVFVDYALDTGTFLSGLFNPSGLVTLVVSPAFMMGLLFKLAVTVILFCNLRATWIAASWVPGTEDALLPLRRGETVRDKFVDGWPRWIWPKMRIPYYLLSTLVLLITTLGAVALVFRHR
jgi:hypothetical protein